MQILRWPKDYTFPAIDIVRLTILNPPACALLLSRHSEELLDILLDQLSHSDKPANQMLALRSLANLFTNDRGILYYYITYVLHEMYRVYVRLISKQLQCQLIYLRIKRTLQGHPVAYFLTSAKNMIKFLLQQNTWCFPPLLFMDSNNCQCKWLCWLASLKKSREKRPDYFLSKQPFLPYQSI